MAIKRSVKPLQIRVDARSAVPVYEQVKQAIKLQILSGYLLPEDQLPPIRDLALQLGVNPNTIVKVYTQLEHEGFAAPQHGLGYFVTTRGDARVAVDSDLLAAAADEFITKALGLGCAPEEILGTLKRRLERHSGKNPQEETDDHHS